jgi:hypothetical protein
MVVVGDPPFSEPEYDRSEEQPTDHISFAVEKRRAMMPITTITPTVKYRDFCPRRHQVMSNAEMWVKFEKGVQQAEITIVDPSKDNGMRQETDARTNL